MRQALNFSIVSSLQPVHGCDFKSAVLCITIHTLSNMYVNQNYIKIHGFKVSVYLFVIDNLLLKQTDTVLRDKDSKTWVNEKKN